ncbi:hypothetical protein BDN72DRAFT_895186 [Pluteus cervinus]|uniref:Uncharacterized protein n=1 Tax=Pluteus cervinus TaxID=181527 RepID=A0ACD3B0Z1_9AGAR|nr:hypothetical protein BDN72DRAFT_895186 [Pluteus cervinus]
MTSLASLSIHGLTPDAAYRKLDEEIAQLQSRLCSLRTLRNTLSPICKIPTELLSKIFTHTQEYNSPTFYGKVDLHARWIVSWVCRHWRDIALTSPSLWTIICSQRTKTRISLDLFQELLIRSRNMPLFVGLHNPPLDTLKMCLSHMPRIQHLRLASTLLPEVADLLDQPAPLLTSLELRIVALRSATNFQGVYPRLKRLIIETTPFVALSALITPVLTTLRIINPVLQMGVNDLIGQLPSLQRLTELVLGQCFRDDEDVASLPRRIRLPNLQDLALSEVSYNLMFDFITCLDVPQADVSVSWPEDVEEVTDTDRDDFWTGLNLLVREAEIPLPIRHLKLRRKEPDFTADISSSPSQHRYSFQIPNPHLASTFLFYSTIPLENLETLDTNNLPVGILRDLAALTKLKSVTVKEEAAWTFIEMFSFKPDANETPFPAVKELTVQGIHLTEDDRPSLEDTLEVRKEAGYGLDKLVFRRCEDVEVDNFKNFVNVIEVVE